MKDYILKLLNDGDIKIVEIDYELSNGIKIFNSSKRVYHKSFNIGEKIKDNLLEAYKEWEKLTGGQK